MAGVFGGNRVELAIAQLSTPHRLQRTVTVPIHFYVLELGFSLVIYVVKCI